jgi:hypothetical protein
MGNPSFLIREIREIRGSIPFAGGFDAPRLCVKDSAIPAFSSFTSASKMPIMNAR